MASNGEVLVEMTDRGLLDLWWIDHKDYFKGMELCLQPWVRYCFHLSMSFIIDEGMLLERARQLDGDVKRWQDFDADRMCSIYCVTIHIRDENLEWMQYG